jgi:microcystin-dependent protein
MGQPYVGQLLLVGFSFAPVDWNICAGQIIGISTNQALYALIGTTYGGDGVQTFGLPNLQGRIPVHVGTGYVIGQIGGAETVSITAANFPTHTHTLVASSVTGTLNTPANNSVAAGTKFFRNEAPAVAMNPSMVTTAPGGNLPHDNLQPYVALNWIIAMSGIYPTQQ